MNVTILGCGALGSVVAFHLHGSGHPGLNLELIQRPGEHFDALKSLSLIHISEPTRPY